MPTLSQMIREGSESAAKIKRATKEALVEWFAQSKRLNIARTHYGLRGERRTLLVQVQTPVIDQSLHARSIIQSAARYEVELA